MTGQDLDRARDALHHLDPGCCREDWHRIGRAAIAAGLSVDDLDAWSSTASNYRGERDVRAAFRTITPEGGTGPASLFYLAHAEGWKEPAAGTAPSPRKAPVRPAEPPRPPRPGMGAAEVLARCKPAAAEHGYIVAKQGRPEGLRVVPDGDQLHIAGQSMAGALVVPVLPLAGGEPTSLQFIATPAMAATWKAAGRPSKLNLPGASVAGVFIVGELVAGGTAYLCEGIGQAWACWKATGAAAVVCFGWGRVRGVAADLRQRDASARLVLVPDVGKEADAETIALEVGAAVAAMPEGWPVNADVNDLAQRDGFDVLEVLLSRASEPPKPEPTVHPLARYVDLDAEPMAPRFVIPGFIGYGLVIFAGTHGVGKTTALLPLAMVAAGLHGHGDPLAPKHWRHVVYITEDTEQALRIVAGIVNFGGLGLDAGTVRERLHIVEARRLEPSYVAEVATTYREQFARTVDGVEVPPLVVMDTKSAVFSIEEENSNSEASAIVAMLKQSFQSLPVWLVGHVAKANMSRGDVAGLALRGASAFEGDANQTLYLVKEGEARYLVRGKTRFEAEWPELQIESKTAATMARDEYGDLQAVTLRWGIASPPAQSRKEAQEQAQEAARKAEAAAMWDEVRGAVQVAWQGGFPLNREGVKAKVKRNRAEVTDTIENLLAERWLHEVAVPAKERTNPKRAAFLVNLTTEEHEAARRGEGMPPAKLEVPASWRKPAAPSVPDGVPQETGEVTHASHE
jgi:putative DNA primase/helicase